jgi:hypothetical protein
MCPASFEFADGGASAEYPLIRGTVLEKKNFAVPILRVTAGCHVKVSGVTTTLPNNRDECRQRQPNAAAA